MMRLSIATTNIPGELSQKLEQIAAAGFTGVELYEPDLVGYSESPQRIGAHARSLGLKIELLQPFHDFEGHDGAERRSAFSRLGHKLDLMHALGAQSLMVGTNKQSTASADTAKIIEDFHLLAERIGDSGCRAAIIALPWARHIMTELHALNIVESVNSPHLGLALNSFFSLASGQQAARLRDIPGERIFFVQLADAPALDFDITRLKSHFSLLPGQGGLNLSSFVRVVARAGYAGCWSIARVGSRTDSRPGAHARDAYRSVVSLLDEVSQSEPALARPSDALPPRVTPTGIEFIEFATSEHDHARLTKLLSTLCFRKERAHKSKDVELWRQGAINIVVNSEPKGLAAEARTKHGPGVCDMGLRVRDAAQTVTRATALGAPAFSQPVGNGELDIPAVKGVGGSVVHFIDEKSNLHRVWDIEFAPVPKTRSAQPAGLRRIDHVAQTMRYEEMQSWLTYYLSTFKMEKAPVVDVADPSGIVLSQALASPEGEVRLNLNGAGEQRTFAGSFLTQGFGAGVQHLAFVTDDIFETSEQLAAAGFERLAIADNYYKDIRVRFDLCNEMIAKLKTGNILYDRDGRGEYFQIYSVPIWGGFFFEIVARAGGYQGYGAPNARIRLAAQMRYLKELEHHEQ